MNSCLRLTLGGNATVMLEAGSARVVTDPWLSHAIGPWRRLESPALTIEQLRGATLVLISHGHADHLDPLTMSHLPQETPVLSPAGRPLRRLRALALAVRPLTEWEKWQGEGICVIAVPAYHTRWSLGYVLELGGQRVYFPGDPNPRTPFAEISRRCGSLDVALLPVGGSSLAFGRLQRHLTPALAARAAAELRPRVVVPIHWGHVRCIPGFLDRFRGTAELFAAACRKAAPHLEVLMPEEGDPVCVPAIDRLLPRR